MNDRLIEGMDVKPIYLKSCIQLFCAKQFHSRVIMNKIDWREPDGHSGNSRPAKLQTNICIQTKLLIASRRMHVGHAAFARSWVTVSFDRTVLFQKACTRLTSLLSVTENITNAWNGQFWWLSIINVNKSQNVKMKKNTSLHENKNENDRSICNNQNWTGRQITSTKMPDLSFPAHPTSTSAMRRRILSYSHAADIDFHYDPDRSRSVAISVFMYVCLSAHTFQKLHFY